MSCFWSRSQFDLLNEALERIEQKLGPFRALTITELMDAFGMDELQVIHGVAKLGALYVAKPERKP